MKIMSGRKKRRDRETDEDESDAEMQKSKKQNRIYRQRFKLEYRQEFPTLSTSSRGPDFAHCTVCKSDFSVAHGGRNDCIKHVQRQAHQKAEECMKNVSCIKSAFGAAAYNLQHQTTLAEAMICRMVADLNLSLSAAESISKMLPVMFPDSKIAAGELINLFIYFFFCT